MTNILNRGTKGLPRELTSFVRSLIEQGVKSFGQPGASLTWGILEGDETIEGGEVSVGIEGEKVTAKVLNNWAKTRENAIIVNSVRWPGSEHGDTDHLLIIGNKVIVIDSKRWKSKRKYTISETGNIKRGNQVFEHGKVKIGPALKSWKKVIPSEFKVIGIVCIAQDEVFVEYDNAWRKSFYKLVTLEQLPHYLDELIDGYDTKDIDFVHLGLVTRVVSGIIKPRDRRSEVIKL